MEGDSSTVKIAVIISELSPPERVNLGHFWVKEGRGKGQKRNDSSRAGEFKRKLNERSSSSRCARELLVYP